MATRRTREFWQQIVAEYERGGEPRRVVAARHGVSPKSLTWWGWTLRRERELAPEGQPVQFMAVEVTPSGLSCGEAGTEVGKTETLAVDSDQGRTAQEDRMRDRKRELAVRMGALEVTFEEGTNVGYVGQLLGRLKEVC